MWAVSKKTAVTLIIAATTITCQMVSAPARYAAGIDRTATAVARSAQISSGRLSLDPPRRV